MVVVYAEGVLGSSVLKTSLPLNCQTAGLVRLAPDAALLLSSSSLCIVRVCGKGERLPAAWRREGTLQEGDAAGTSAGVLIGSRDESECAGPAGSLNHHHHHPALPQPQPFSLTRPAHPSPPHHPNLTDLRNFPHSSPHASRTPSFPSRFPPGAHR